MPRTYLTPPLFLTVLLWASCLFTQPSTAVQDTILVEFNGYNLTEGEHRRGYGYFVPVHIVNDSVYFKNERYRVIYPESLDPTRIAVGDNYFTGISGIPTGVSIPHLIYNYESQTPTIYVDPSGTFNFENTQPHKFAPGDSSLIVTIENSENSDCKFQNEYRKARHKDEEQKLRSSSFFSKSGPLPSANEAIDADHWLRDRRMNYRYNSFTYGDIKYRVGIYDYNCNGEYDNEEDIVMFKEGNTPLEEGLSKDGYLYKENMIIGSEKQAFRLVSVSECGQQLKLVPIEAAVSRSGLREGSFIIDLPSEVEISRTTGLKSLLSDDKLTLIDVWGSWCKPCLLALPDLVTFEKNNRATVKVVGLNYGDTDDIIAKIEAKHGVNWLSWRITKEQVGKLNIAGYPSYLLFNQKGELLHNTNDLKKIEATVANLRE